MRRTDTAPPRERLKSLAGVRTWHGGERAPGVHGRLDGDDALSLRTPALLALSLHLEQVGMVGQQVLDDHGVLCWVRHVNALHLTWRTNTHG